MSDFLSELQDAKKWQELSDLAIRLFGKDRISFSFKSSVCACPDCNSQSIILKRSTEPKHLEESNFKCLS